MADVVLSDDQKSITDIEGFGCSLEVRNDAENILKQPNGKESVSASDYDSDKDGDGIPDNLEVRFDRVSIDEDNESYHFEGIGWSWFGLTDSKSST